jgi:glutathione S-transferase
MRRMIKLLQYASQFDIPCPSPFCMKVETYLRMTELPFEVVVTPDPRKAPKQKLPVIVDEGETIADSAMILKHLKAKHGDELDGSLTPIQHAMGYLAAKTMEESFYWVMMHDRWLTDSGWDTTKPAFFAELPPIVRSILPGVLRKATRKQCKAQGYGRHTVAEIADIGKADLNAVSTIMGNNDFLLGDKPSSYDATVYAFVGNTVDGPYDAPTTHHARLVDNLVAYCKRMKQTYFADWNPAESA